MSGSYILCPQCGIRRFSVFRNAIAVVFMLTRKGEMEIIKPEDNTDTNYTDDELVQCLGCSWKGSFRKLLNSIK